MNLRSDRSLLRGAADDVSLLPLRLYYQPIVDLNGGAVVAYEGLLRLQLGSGQVLTPAGFFHTLERSRLMPEVTRWVISAAAAKLACQPTLSLFINLDRESLGDYGIIDWAASELDLRQIKHCRLGFEISERTAIRNNSAAVAWLTAARERGFGLALDDFGSGGFTLEHLLSLPTDAVKVDRLLTQRLYLGENPGLLKTLTSIASWHAKPLILEGIATPEMVDFALSHGIGIGQGYYLGLPAPQPQPLGHRPSGQAAAEPAARLLC